MKLELPLAIILLAIGGWHWMSGSFSTNNATSKVATQQSSEFTDAVPGSAIPELSPQDNFGASTVQQAAYLEPAFANALTVFDEEPDGDEPGILLAQAAKQLELAPSIVCKSRCRINLFGQSITGEGNYYQKGQGSKLTRMELTYQISDELSLQSTQVCDGKFFYSIQQLGEERTIEFIDLQRLRSESMHLNGGPSRWLSQAGTVSLLRNLSSAFDFDPPQPAQLGNHPMLHLKGRWKRKALEGVLRGQIDFADDHPIDWSRIPDQIPHSVEVFLGEDNFLNLFPYRINFFKLDQDGQPQQTPTIAMELYEVQKVDQLPDHLFRVNSEGSRPVDLSQNYCEHLEHLAESIQHSTTQRR